MKNMRMNKDSQLARLGLFDARVPRYTSYPTAPQFSEAVGAETFTDWISAIPEGAEISLYIHVPFCRRLCWFCACRTQGTQTLAPVAAYVETLCEEIRRLGALLPGDVRLSRLHWGGGTPTLLSPDLIDRVAGTIAEVLPFAGDAEFSVEIDPDEIDEARLTALAAAGMNRASIGVQDFDEEIQAAIGRPQGYELTRDVVAMIRTHDIASLNADILYGLPHQSPARLSDTVGKLLSFAPDRVALYGYAHVPWMSKRQRLIPTDALPTAEERLNLFETARRLFLQDGYDEIGIDHFARPGDGLARAHAEGRLRRNFQGYTDDTAEVLIGLGASSISRFPQGYTQNTPATGAWAERIQAGGFATYRGHAFAGEDRLRGRMIEFLMCDFRIDAARMRAEGADGAWLTARFAEVAAQFPGMVEWDSAGFAIRREGRPLARMIARGFDAYALSQAGHSAAI